MPSDNGNNVEETMQSTVRVVVKDSSGRVLLVSEGGDKVIGMSARNRPICKRRGTGLPGGHVQDGESPREAAIRELQEETGLTADIELEPIYEELKILQKVTVSRVVNPEGEVRETKSSRRVVVFLAVNPRGEIKINREEDIVAAFWVHPNRMHGSFKHEGIDYPPYESHMNWINGIF